MSLMEKIKVGDVLSHPGWGNNEYRVEEVRGEEAKIRNIFSDWEGWILIYTLTKDVIINGGVAEKDNPNKTAIERKITFMQKRWEKRNEPKPSW